jgi:glycosyltransferase involved in cell wall biosynthesis
MPPASEWEVVVVLDGVPCADGFAAAHRLPGLRWLPLPSQRGRGGARNAGIDAARGEVVILLDEDVVVCPGFLAAHLREQARRPGLCHGPLRELPALAWFDDEGLADTGNAGVPRRISELASRVLRDLDDPDLCFERHGSVSRLERDGVGAYMQGRRAVSWVAFAGANLSAPRDWLLEDKFDERPGARWGLEDLSLALRWSIEGRPLAVAFGARALHLSHPRPGWRETQRANLCCLDFLPEAAAASVLTYLEGATTLDALEAALLPVVSCQTVETA